MGDIAERSFEEAWAELEAVLARLEGDDLSLDDSVELFERGRNLAAHCQTLLDKAELRVRQLSGEVTDDENPLPPE